MTADAGLYGFGSHIGLQIDQLRDGRSQLSLDLMAHHRNFFGIVHGGVLLTMLDQTCGAALRGTRPAGSPQGSATIDLQTAFVAAAKGDRLLGHGTCLRRGRSIAHCTAVIEDGEGTLVATATGTFKLFY